jgi:N-acetylglucosaminyldiphosphoundecaprenol N-acetyl-beta-D-mannosaminyltransferase
LTDVNAGKIIQIKGDDTLKKSVEISDLINADGQSLIWASRLLGKPLKERVAGIDLMGDLVKLAHENNFKVFLFGAKEEVVKKVVNIYTEMYGKDLIAGYRNGYFNQDEEATIAKEIADSGAHMLFVAITSPFQENFMFNNKEVLKPVNFKMGVGGSFDVISGMTKRAPVWMQKNGLEWFYRFLQEPKRMWKRYLVGNSKFIFLVLKQRFGFKT